MASPKRLRARPTARAADELKPLRDCLAAFEQAVIAAQSTKKQSDKAVQLAFIKLIKAYESCVQKQQKRIQTKSGTASARQSRAQEDEMEDGITNDTGDAQTGDEFVLGHVGSNRQTQDVEVSADVGEAEHEDGGQESSGHDDEELPAFAI